MNEQQNKSITFWPTVCSTSRHSGMFDYQRHAFASKDGSINLSFTYWNFVIITYINLIEKKNWTSIFDDHCVHNVKCHRNLIPDLKTPIRNLHVWIYSSPNDITLGVTTKCISDDKLNMADIVEFIFKMETFGKRVNGSKHFLLLP